MLNPNIRNYLKKYLLATLIHLLFLKVWSQSNDNMKHFAIVIHGGAGTILPQNMTADLEKAYKERLQAALSAGFTVLEKGGSSTDAVEAAIKIMEDSPLFNAGKGSVFTNDGKNEMDAAIMDGKTLKAGAVAGVRVIKNPVSAARAVMDKSNHVMMIGKGAEKFALECKLEIVDTAYFFEERRWKQLLKAKKEEKQILDHSDTSGINDIDLKDKKFGTVGAVALDKDGNLSAATSTGGMTNKRFGRVGDSPIIGAGTYADNVTCAVSCTGHGEYFIRNVVAYDVAAMMKYGKLSMTDAANEIILKKLVSQGGEGGLIAIDKQGNIAMPFNTAGMYRGFMKSDGKSGVFIYKDEK